MSNCMKYGGKVKKMEKGGMTRNQEAYAEGLKIAKGKPILRNIDKAASKLASKYKSEKEMIDKGYEDMLKAKEYQEKANKKESLIERRRREKKEALEAVEKGLNKGGMLKAPDNPGLKKLPTEVRNKMGYMKKGGAVKKGYHRMPDGSIMKDSAHKKKMAHGGMVGKCKRDGVAVRGKTKAGR